MTTTNQFAARFQNHEAVLIAPDSQMLFAACLEQAATIQARLDAAADQPLMDDGDGFWPAPTDWRASFRPYVVKDGILLIPVKGVLLNDFTYNFGNWATGYQYIWRAFDRGQKDPEVRGIALVCDTPGGMVAGNFELVDKMHAYPNRKPVRGYAHEAAYSAGYSIVSVSDPGEITVSRTGGVGSIGVVTSHTDVSKLYDDIGYKVTFIHAGKHKVDGNPYEALPADVKARIQKRIDDLYSIFVSTVARNRSMDEQAIRDTEALTYSAPDALSIGLADKIGAFDDSLADFSASLNPSEGDETMAELTQADIDNAVATATSGHAAALAAAKTEGATAERARINAILETEEAKVRPSAALALALEGDMSVESTTKILGKLPEETKGSTAAAEPEATTGAGVGKNRFEAGMENSQNPDVGELARKPGEEDKEELAIDQSFGGRAKPKAA